MMRILLVVLACSQMAATRGDSNSNDEAGDEAVVMMEVEVNGDQSVYPTDGGFDKLLELAFKQRHIETEWQNAYEEYGELLNEKRVLDERRSFHYVPENQRTQEWFNTHWSHSWEAAKLDTKRRFASHRLFELEMEARAFEAEHGVIEPIERLLERYGYTGYQMDVLEANYIKKFLDEESNRLHERYWDIRQAQRALEEEKTASPDLIDSSGRDTDTQFQEWRVRTQNLFEQQRFTRTRLVNIEMKLQILNAEDEPTRRLAATSEIVDDRNEPKSRRMDLDAMARQGLVDNGGLPLIVDLCLVSADKGLLCTGLDTFSVVEFMESENNQHFGGYCHYQLLMENDDDVSEAFSLALFTAYAQKHQIDAKKQKHFRAFLSGGHLYPSEVWRNADGIMRFQATNTGPHPEEFMLIVTFAHRYDPKKDPKGLDGDR